MNSDQVIGLLFALSLGYTSYFTTGIIFTKLGIPEPIVRKSSNSNKGNQSKSKTFFILAFGIIIGIFGFQYYEFYQDSKNSEVESFSSGIYKAPKKVSREEQMHDCYDRCVDTRDTCLAEGIYRPAVCYDNYDACSGVVCCSQFKDLNPLCR